MEDNKSKKKDEDEFDDTFVILEDGERVHISWVFKTIKKEDGKYCVYSKNGKRKFGCYSTRKES